MFSAEADSEEFPANVLFRPVEISCRHVHSIEVDAFGSELGFLSKISVHVTFFSRQILDVYQSHQKTNVYFSCKFSLETFLDGRNMAVVFFSNATAGVTQRLSYRFRA